MYRMNEIELWNQRRGELVREAESGRLARRLRAARPKRAAWFRGTFLGRAPEVSAHPCAESGGRA